MLGFLIRAFEFYVIYRIILFILKAIKLSFFVKRFPSSGSPYSTNSRQEERPPRPSASAEPTSSKGQVVEAEFRRL